ncbi:hypothetical protein SFRURICE_006335, partial [Spodoptera frugiperda]
GRGFAPFDPLLLSIKLDVVLSLNGLEVSPLSHCIVSSSNCVIPLQPVLMARLKNPYVYVATTDVIVLPEDYEIEFAKPIATKPSGSHNQFYYYSVQSTYPSKSNERIDSDVRKKQILISNKTTHYKKPYSIDSAEDEVIRKSESKIHKKPSILEMDEYRRKDKVIYREPVAEIIYERRTHPSKQNNKKQYLTKPKEYAVERQDFKTIYYYNPTRSTSGHPTEKDVFGGLYYTDRIRGKFEEPATELVVEFRKTLPSDRISYKDNKYSVHKSGEREKYTQSAKQSLSYRKTLSSKKYASRIHFEETKIYDLFTLEMSRHKKPKHFKSNESRKFLTTERKHSVKNIPTELFSFNNDEHFENFYGTSSTKTPYKITNYKHPYFIEMDEVGRVHSTNEPHHGEVSTTNRPQHKEVSTTNRPHHEEVYSTNKPTHAEVYSTNKPTHAEVHSTNRPHHAEVQSSNRPTHEEVPLKDKLHYEGPNYTNRPHPVSVHSSNRPYHGESFSNVRLHYEGGYSNDNMPSSNDRPHHGKVYSNVRLHYEEGYPTDTTTSSSDISEHEEGYTNIRPHYEEGYSNDIMTSSKDKPYHEEVYSNLRPHYKDVYPHDITTSSTGRPYHEEMYSNLRPYYEGVYRNDITTTSSDRSDHEKGYSTVRPHYEGVYSSDIMTSASDRPYHGEGSNVRPHYEGGYSIDKPHHEGDYTTDRSHPEQVSDTLKPYPIDMKEYDENLADMFKNYQPVTSADDPFHVNLLNPTPTISGSNDSTFDSMYLMSVLGNKTDKCYTCGMDEVDYTSEICYLVFEHTDRTYKYKMRSYKSKCSGKTFIGGCFKRFLDIGHYYSERGCREFPPAQGHSFASSRYASIERMLLRTDEGCTVSPAATLVPFSRSVLLYARFHVCVCTKNYCNNSSMLSGNLMFYFILIYFFLSNKCFIISII